MAEFAAGAVAQEIRLHAVATLSEAEIKARNTCELKVVANAFCAPIRGARQETYVFSCQEYSHGYRRFAIEAVASAREPDLEL